MKSLFLALTGILLTATIAAADSAQPTFEQVQSMNKERVQKMNQFKLELSKMSPSDREAAISEMHASQDMQQTRQRSRTQEMTQSQQMQKSQNMNQMRVRQGSLSTPGNHRQNTH